MTGHNDGGGKRKQILEAAIKVFANNGFYNSKVEEIANEANVGKGTVYEYFNSKQDLFQEMLKYIHNIYFTEFMADISHIPSLKEKLIYLIKSHLDFIIERKEMAKVFLSEHPPIDEKLKKWLLEKEKEKMLLLETYLQESMEKKEIRSVEPRLTANMIAGVINYVGSCIIVSKEELTADDVIDLPSKAVDFLFHGLAK